jgi:polysaccharide biosynthesis protein PslF
MPIVVHTPLMSGARPRTQSRRIGLVSTYPPTKCGIATFGAALVGAFEDDGHRVDVVCIDDSPNGGSMGLPIVARLVNGVSESIRRSATALDRCDMAMVQHEYGIFGGPDGEEVLALLDAINVPTVVILHTVPLEPTPNQRSILIDICGKADRAVVMTETAYERLIELYPVDPGNIQIIAHGAAAPTPRTAGESAKSNATPPDLLTWGLLGPGKGIEHVIDALALLADQGFRPQYTVAGVTHPNVFAQHGDAYRNSLIQRARDAGVADQVRFDATYFSVADLTRFIASSRAVVLPYDSRDQVTSGVLVDAIAAGRPVIATAFPHAVELLESGAGIVVPHADPGGLADAIRVAITDDDALAAMTAVAATLAPALLWSAVADQYLDLCDELCDATDRVAV